MKIEEKNNKKKEFLKFICFQIKKERKKKGREFIRINFFLIIKIISEIRVRV